MMYLTLGMSGVCFAQGFQLFVEPADHLIELLEDSILGDVDTAACSFHNVQFYMGAIILHSALLGKILLSVVVNAEATEEAREGIFEGSHISTDSFVDECLKLARAVCGCMAWTRLLRIGVGRAEKGR